MPSSEALAHGIITTEESRHLRTLLTLEREKCADLRERNSKLLDACCMWQTAYQQVYSELVEIRCKAEPNGR